MLYLSNEMVLCGVYECVKSERWHMFVLRKFLFRHSFLNPRKVNVLIVCLLVNLLTLLTVRNGTTNFCLRQTKNVVVHRKIYDGKRDVMLNTRTLLLSPCNDTVRTIRMGTVSGSWRMMERTMCL